MPSVLCSGLSDFWCVALHLFLMPPPPPRPTLFPYTTLFRSHLIRDRKPALAQRSGRSNAEVGGSSPPRPTNAIQVIVGCLRERPCTAREFLSAEATPS